MKEITGGVCAPQGFKAAGVHCGIRKNKSKRDLALIVSDRRAAAAGVYTRNKVKGAPIAVTKSHIADGFARAIVCNSGNANTCNADGVQKAEQMCRLVMRDSGIDENDVIVASTGVIGQILPIEPIDAAMPALVKALKADGSSDAAEAIMTTDTVKKEFACEFELGGKTCRIGAIAKGSGMIHPNMATLLCFVTSDAAIVPEMLAEALKEVIDDTLNMVSIDGDSSTNDMAMIVANGAAGNAPIDAKGADYETFKTALLAVMTRVSRAIAKDGEGSSPQRRSPRASYAVRCSKPRCLPRTPIGDAYCARSAMPTPSATSPRWASNCVRAPARSPSARAATAWNFRRTRQRKCCPKTRSRSM